YPDVVHFTAPTPRRLLAIDSAHHALATAPRARRTAHPATVAAEVLVEQNHAEHSVQGNRLRLPAGNEGEMEEVVIDDVAELRGHSKLFDVKTYASYLDLQKAKAINPVTRTGTAREHMFYALSDTEFEVGLTESAREITISFENYTNPY